MQRTKMSLDKKTLNAVARWLRINAINKRRMAGYYGRDMYLEECAVARGFEQLASRIDRHFSDTIMVWKGKRPAMIKRPKRGS